MRIGILSDFHLGYERFYEDSFLQAERAVKEAAADCDVMLIAGDIFDTKTPKPEVLSRAFSIFRPLFQKGWGAKITEYDARDGRKLICNIPVIAIHGTHEMRPKGMINPIQMLESAGFVINAHGAHIMLEKDGERISVWGMGGVPEKQARTALGVLSPKPTQGAFNILMLHQTIKEIFGIPGDFLRIEDLPDGFDLYVCGHLHEHLVHRSENKLLIVPGSTVITQLREKEAGEKGYYIFDTKSGKLEFRRIRTRPFFYKELSFKEVTPDEVMKACRKAIEGFVDSRTVPVVRLKLTGSMKRGLSSQLDVKELEREFSGKVMLFVDKELTTECIEEKIEKIRALREKNLSVKEIGMEVLKERVKDANLSIDAEKLFEILSNEKKDAEEMAEEIMKDYGFVRRTVR